jgi:hypothetical protein
MRSPDQPLVIPAWVPVLVAAEPRRLHTQYADGNTAQRALAGTIERLAADQRMRGVWHKSCIAALPERSQVGLFRSAIAFAFWPAVPRRDIDKARDMAATLRADVGKHGRVLEHAAAVYDQLAADRCGDVIVARDTGDLAVRAFAVRMAAVLVGTGRLSGTIAKMANVVFDCRHISARAVGDWVRQNNV